ncbi:Beta-lactamase hydrolase-like protein [Rhodobacteraceae bacterium THAF1]|uniref:TIGR01244 family sulfur transferase n=1 Tax=Palleronia sp. THAF1 TaxID=2587842 RepID=UPI000F3CABF7|nr:TIGR01244 family sulfur transferase [Palleronia sp. THAF1]QFU08091.1 Beta-lactamase hydrolase-like protein [Palleronia sp. THAF1]VDC27949.1 Beta-lactamase hydrolase-like protein [Rhodobacteraceae bacterium THAF1]
MDIRYITEDYAVSPQIQPADVSELAQQGFTLVICNRPDSEVSGDEASAAIAAACKDAGLDFVRIPVDHSGLTPEMLAAHRSAVETAEGKAFAYCRSGTRSTHIWALGQAGRMPASEIIASGARGGYDLSPLAPTIDALAKAAD